MPAPAPKDLPALLEDAAARGFDQNFELRAQTVHCPRNGKSYALEALNLIETIHHAPGSDPGDEATLFLLECADGAGESERGYLLVGNPASLSADERSLLDRIRAL